MLFRLHFLLLVLATASCNTPAKEQKPFQEMDTAIVLNPDIFADSNFTFIELDRYLKIMLRVKSKSGDWKYLLQAKKMRESTIILPL